MSEYFRKFWSQERHGKHLVRTEEFFAKTAKEQLFHMAGGESLVDFGCGAAEALAHYAGEYKTVVGIDFSAAMLEEAKKRLDRENIKNVSLLHADDKTAWAQLSGSYDRIIAFGVMQYLTADEVDNFIAQASKKLSPNGKLILFACLDPVRWGLRRMGLLNTDGKFSVFGVARECAALAAKKMLAFVRNSPPDDVGYSYHPSEICAMAEKHGLAAECAWSLYYTDRYHVILTPKGR